MDAIVVEDLRKRYKAVQALDGVSFSVREGEVFGLLGPNGAGKSTTVRVLTTLTRADSGTASVAGHDVARHPNRVRRAIGYVAQDSGVDWEATGRENLLLQGRIHGMAGAPLRARVDELLELVGLSDSADRVARTYSGGMKRRLDVAIGLVHKPQRAVPRRADHGPRPGGACGDVGGGRAARARGAPDDPADDALPRGGRPARRAGRDRQPRARSSSRARPDELKAGLEGELVTVELEETDGRLAEAAEVVRAAVGAREVHVEDRFVRARVPNGAHAIPAILSALDERGHPVGGGDHVAAVARRRLPPLHRPRLRARKTRRERADADRAPDRLDGGAPGAQPHARADLDRDDDHPADALAGALRPAVLEGDAAARRRRELRRVPHAGDRVHERVLRRHVGRAWR